MIRLNNSSILPQSEIYGRIWLKISYWVPIGSPQCLKKGLLFVDLDSDFFLFFSTDGRSRTEAFDLVDWHDDFLLSVCDECIDESSIESGKEVSQEAIVELAGAVDVFELERVEIEDHQPIGPLVVAFDGVSQSLFGPEARNKDFTPHVGDHRLDSVRDSTRIAGVVVAIEQEKTFVGCAGQRNYSSLRMTVCFLWCWLLGAYCFAALNRFIALSIPSTSQHWMASRA